MNDDRIIQVPLQAIHPHPRNEEFFDAADQEAFARLKESIAEVGMLTPIRVSKNYTIISGHQRYRACKELGVEFVGVIVDGELEDENEMLMQLIVSNFGRAKNDPIKQGKMIEMYEKLYGISHGGDRFDGASGNNFRLKTQEDLAREFGCDARTLRNLKRLTKLSPEIQEAVRIGKISPTTAIKSLASLPVEDQLKVIASLPEAKARFTQAAVEAEVAKLMSASMERDRAQAHAEESDERLRAAQDSIRDLECQLKNVRQQLSASPREVRVEVEVVPEDYQELQKRAAEYEALQEALADKSEAYLALQEESRKLAAQVAEQSEKTSPTPASSDQTDQYKDPNVLHTILNKALESMRDAIRIVNAHKSVAAQMDLTIRRAIASSIYDVQDDMTPLVRLFNTTEPWKF